MKLAEYKRLDEQEESSFWHLGRRVLIESLLRKFVSPSPSQLPHRSPLMTEMGSFASSRQLRLLDLGCGTGGNFPVLSKFGEVVSCDLEETALLLAKQKFPQGKWMKADAQRLPFASRSFHLLTAFDLLEHLQAEEKALQEWRRVLKKGGLLFLTVPAHPWLWSEHDESLGHHRRYTLASLATLLKRANFRVIFGSYWLFLLFPLIVFQRLMLKLKKRGRSAYPSFPPFLNSLLAGLLSLEGRLVPFLPLPWGSTVVVVAIKAGQT